MRRSTLRATLGSAAVAAVSSPPRRPARSSAARWTPSTPTSASSASPRRTGRFRCSGTLISPRVVLTAGHCTEGPATDVCVSFDDQLRPDPLARASRPPRRPRARRSTSRAPRIPTRAGTASSTFAKQHDQGVVVLDQPATRSGRASRRRRCWRSARWTPTRARSRTRRSRSSATASTSATRRRRSSTSSGCDDGAAQERPVRGRHVPEQRERLQGRRRLVLRRLRRRRVPGSST